MKTLTHLFRAAVGGLFIFSGLIKLNDPVGFAFKLEEYFSQTVLNLPFLEPYALMIAVILVVFEVLLGVFLLLGYRVRFTMISLLGMIIFFTFLTFYSAYFNKVTDCGCFGDAIKLTPWESFTKDVILLVLIVWLYFKQKLIQPLFTKAANAILVLISLIFCLGIVYFVLMHLPILDFRPYKINANIVEQSQIPDDAPKPIIEYTWYFKVNGEEKSFVTNGSYPTVEGGEYLRVETKTIQEGYEPPIHDFSIERDGEDYFQEMMSEPKLLIIFSYNMAKGEPTGMEKIKNLTSRAERAGYMVIGLTATGNEEQMAISSKFGIKIPFYFSDETALKTVVRSNPAVLKLSMGTILDKKHWNDFDQLRFD